MERFAVFIDVGYLYAAGGLACIGGKSRRGIVLDIGSIVRMLAAKSETTCKSTLLRTYWYDGAAHGIPTQEQLTAALVDDVKLRLGRLNSRGQQKGVDALIYRDLMTLGRERAISNAYLLAGDGDLVEGVRAAQDMGVHVSLIYVEPGDGHGVSPELLQEVDRRIVLTRDDLLPYFTKAVTSHDATTSSVSSSQSAPTSVDPESVAAEGRQYAQDWLTQATPADISALTESRPKVPQQIDVELLTRAEKSLNVSLRGNQEPRRVLRAAFWSELQKLLSSS